MNRHHSSLIIGNSFSKTIVRFDGLGQRGCRMSLEKSAENHLNIYKNDATAQVLPTTHPSLRVSSLFEGRGPKGELQSINTK
jgi:hypothetical protein